MTIGFGVEVAFGVGIFVLPKVESYEAVGELIVLGVIEDFL